MKKSLFGVCLLVLCCLGLKAQNAPQAATMHVEEFEYKSLTAGKVAINALMSVAMSANVVYTQDKSMVPQINEAIAASVTGIPWLGISDDKATADYCLKGIISEAKIGSGTSPSCMINVHATIVDNKTGKVLATKMCQGISSAVATVVTSVSDVKSGATRYLKQSITNYIFQVLPVTGKVLEKGVEQANGKVKDNQCYVSIGSLHGVFPDMLLYVVENGKYKGELKVKEVMGDDLCSCKIVNGKSYIEKSLQKGIEPEVTSKPKKL